MITNSSAEYPIHHADEEIEEFFAFISFIECSGWGIPWSGVGIVVGPNAMVCSTRCRGHIVAFGIDDSFEDGSGFSFDAKMDFLEGDAAVVGMDWLDLTADLLKQR